MPGAHGRLQVNCLLLELTVPPQGNLGPRLSNKSSVDGRKRDFGGRGLLVVLPAETWYPVIPLSIPRTQDSDLHFHQAIYQW